MAAQVALVTGGTGGIGFHTSVGLAKAGFRVLVTGRDAARGASAIEALRRESGSAQVELVLGDLGRISEVRALAQQVLALAPALSVVVHNAGAMAERLERTQDGLERNFAVNVAAPYLLTQLLRPALRAASPSRVVVLSGGTAGAAVGSLGRSN